MSSFKIYPPSTPGVKEFDPNEFKYDDIMGKWFVVASTLPMWKSKKNVTITYTPIPDSSSSTTSTSPSSIPTIDDLVQYHSSLTSDPTSTLSKVEGIDRPEVALSGDGKGEDTYTNGVRWKWRGKGWLKIASSHWQIIAFSLPPKHSSSSTDDDTQPQPQSNDQHESNDEKTPTFLLTYFSSTLFTPSGIDLYSRNPHPKGKEEQEQEKLFRAEIKKRLENGEAGEEVEKLVREGWFEILHD